MNRRNGINTYSKFVVVVLRLYVKTLILFDIGLFQNSRLYRLGVIPACFYRPGGTLKVILCMAYVGYRYPSTATKYLNTLNFTSNTNIF